MVPPFGRAAAFFQAVAKQAAGTWIATSFLTSAARGYNSTPFSEFGLDRLASFFARV
jgi:hypothetical protein